MHKIWINGRWQDSAATVGRETTNPATLKPVGVVPDCNDDDVRRAVAAAQAARTAWQGVAAGERAALLHGVAAAIRVRAASLANLLTRESGTPLCESRDEVEWAAARFDRIARGPRSRDDSSGGPGAAGALDATPAIRDLVLASPGPAGVVAAGASPTFPLLSFAACVAPAIAQGNTVVIKAPAPNPLATLLLTECCASLPPGVVNVITGAADTAVMLADHPGVSLPAEAAAPPVQPIIVLDDADLDLAAAGIAWTRLRHSGQDAATSVRIFVTAAIAAGFADRLHEYIAFLEVGDPAKRDTDLGPLLTHEAASRVEQQAAYALKDGARLKLGGRGFRPWGLPGHFFQPTLLTGVRPDSVADTRDIRGPVLSLIVVADSAEAIGRAEAYKNRLPVAVYSRAAPPALTGSLDHVQARRSWWFPYRERESPAA